MGERVLACVFMDLYGKVCEEAGCTGDNERGIGRV